MMMADESKVGFTYHIEHIRDGVVLSDEVCQNLVPTAGLNHMLELLLKNAVAYQNWYVALYEGNYTPVATATMATLPVDCQETTAYDETTRVPYVTGTVSNGTINNVASKAEFTFNATKTIYGGFLTSSSAKSSATGMAASVVRFSSPKPVTPGDILRVTAGLTLTSS